jgi:hypothetical protein
MTQRQKISIAIGTLVMIAILLGMAYTAKPQGYNITSMSGYGLKGDVEIFGYAMIQSDSTITIKTDFGKLDFQFVRSFDIGAKTFYDLRSAASKFILIIDRNTESITLNRRYRGRKEQTIRYSFKKRI